MAWQEGREISYLKGLSAESAHKAIATVKGAVVIHFRWATVGGQLDTLCHPFPVTAFASAKKYGHAKQVLFHNGHWSGWEKFLDENMIELAGAISDSRVAAVAVHRFGEEFLEEIGDRFVLFSVKGGVEHFGKWEEVDGCQFSNLFWQRHLITSKARAKSFTPYKLSVKRPRQAQLRYTGESRSLVEQAMICFGD